MEKWDYLETEPAPDAPVCDNPSGLYCPDCRGARMIHCAHPEWCGGMRLMRGRPYDGAVVIDGRLVIPRQ